MPKTSIRKSLPLIILTLFINACVTTPPPKAPEEVQQTFDKACAMRDRDHQDSAYDIFTGIYRAYPDHELAPKALFEAASIADNTSPARAIKDYETLLHEYPETPSALKACKPLLLDYLNCGRFNDASLLYTRIFRNNPNPANQELGNRIISTFMEKKAYARALDVIALIYPFGMDEDRTKMVDIWKTATDKIHDPEYLNLLKNQTDAPDLIEILLSRLALLASGAPDKGVFLPESTPYKGTGPVNTIGVLVPLKGRLDVVGQKIIKGVELASGVFSDRPSPGVEYLIMDYGSDNTVIPDMISSLDQDNVIAIIGPVGEEACKCARKRAQDLGIPLISFTQANLERNEDSFCFRNFITTWIQAKTLLETARDQGILSFAILYPTDRFGNIFSSIFEEMAANYGIKVVRTIGYSPRKVDFKKEVSSLIQGLPEGAAPDFDALLIPDSATNSAMIASYLSYYDIEGVRLFGPSLWNTPDFIRIGGKNVEDAIFVSGFFTDSRIGFVQDFTNSFYYTFGYNPSVWEASAYDTANILQNILRDEVHTRASLKDRITSLKDYPGVSGATSFSSDGSLDKVIFILTVKNHTIVEMPPSEIQGSSYQEAQP
ncbi:MAG: ABC transporter substrate-binding protein [Thermodesulfobacteriota bacterium]|nr:ABC transporter substrate-binding protein [Thermodesulfobacteriota bacterium]